MSIAMVDQNGAEIQNEGKPGMGWLGNQGLYRQEKTGVTGMHLQYHLFEESETSFISSNMTLLNSSNPSR